MTYEERQQLKLAISQYRLHRLKKNSRLDLELSRDLETADRISRRLKKKKKKATTTAAAKKKKKATTTAAAKVSPLFNNRARPIAVEKYGLEKVKEMEREHYTKVLEQRGWIFLPNNRVKCPGCDFVAIRSAPWRHFKGCSKARYLGGRSVNKPFIPLDTPPDLC